MVNQKWVAISYCLAFLSVYFLFCCYCIVPALLNEISSSAIPTTQVMNDTTSAISSLNFIGTSTASWFSIVLIVGLIVVILGIISSIRSMGMAI